MSENVIVPLVSALIGGGLAALGGWGAIKLQFAEAKAERIERTRVFCVDILTSLSLVIGRIQDEHGRFGPLPRDLLDHINLELQAFYRNREHLIDVEDITIRRRFQNIVRNVALGNNNILSYLGEAGQLVRPSTEYIDASLEARQKDVLRRVDEAKDFLFAQRAELDALVTAFDKPSER